MPRRRSDTSIWIDFFRGRDPAAATLERLLDAGALVVCGPILAELVAGTPPQQRGALWLALAALPVVELDSSAWRGAGEYTQALRARGETTPLLDVLIGVAAARVGAAVWTRDDDFARIREVLPELELYVAGD
jgi:predicted nucleic acid-binding protein